MPSQTSLDSATLVCVTQDTLASKVGGDVAILDLAQGRYYGLNPVGAFLWDQLQQPLAVRELQSRLLREFDVDEETAGHDLAALLAQLLEAGLIEVRHGDP